MFTAVNGQRDRGNHEGNRRPGGCSGERTGRSPWSESGLAALPAKRGGDIAGIAALQQDNDDDEETNQDVNCNDQTVNHNLIQPCGRFPRALKWN